MQRLFHPVLSLSLLLPLLLLFSTYSLPSAHAHTVPQWHSFRLADFNGTIFSTSASIFSSSSSSSSPLPPPHLLHTLLHRLRLLPTSTDNVALLDVDGIRILIDAPFSITSHLSVAGFSPESVDAVLLTHGHYDRVAGLITSSGQRAFVNADVYVAQREHENCYEDDLEYRYAIEIYVEDDAVFLIDDNDVPVRHVRVRAAHGHSPGHGIVEVTVNESRLIITGDLLESTSNIPCSSSASGDEAVAMDDLVVGDTAKQVREAFLNEFASSGQLLLDFHGSFPGLGYVTRARKSRRKEQGRGVGTGMIDGIDVEYGRYEYKWEDVDVSRIDVLDSTQFHEQCLA